MSTEERIELPEPYAYASEWIHEGQTTPHAKTLFWPDDYTGNDVQPRHPVYGTEVLRKLVTYEQAEELAIAAVLADRELWALMHEHQITVAPNYARDGSGQFHGWFAARRLGETWTGDTPLEAMQKCAAAIRKG